MKKTLKFLLATVLMFAFVGNVNAAWEMTYRSIKDGKYTNHSFGTNDPTGYGKNTIIYFADYEFVNEENSKYNAYCLDANKKDPGVGSEFSAQRLDAQNSPWARGLSAIIANASRNTAEGIAASEMAIRTFTMAMKQGAAGTGNGRPSYNYMIYNTASKWLAENTDLANKATGYNCSNQECFFKSMGLSNSSMIKAGAESQRLFVESSTITKEAKKLFYIGLEAAANNSITNSSLTLKKSTKFASGERDDNDTYLVQYDYYEITLGSGDSINDFKFNCTNCDANKKVELVSYYENNGEEHTINNLSSLSFSGSKTITLKVKGTVKRNSGYDCSDINYNITYNTPNGITELYLLSNGEANQRFVVFSPSTGSTDVPNPLAMNLCDNNYCVSMDPKDLEDMSDEEFEKYTTDCCTDLKDFCEDSTQKGRESYCELYSEYCAACESEIIVPNVCTFEKNETTGEVTAIDQKGSTNEAIDGNNNTENIKFCLLRRKKDEAGNSYQAMSNNYCQVYCKEEYEFDFPGAEKVNSGTYFQLNATITATKSCYTSEIDTVKYSNDLLSATTQSEKDAIQTQYNACIDMTVNYDCFEPVVEFEYDEIYNDLIENNGKNKFEKISEEIKDNKITTKYYSNINDQYEGTELSKTDSNVKYVKSTITKVAKYTTPSVFYQQRPTGEITLDGSLDNTVVINGLPIAKNSKYTNSYTLQLKDIGEYYSERSIGASNGSSCSLGRLIDDDTNSVYKEQNKDNTDINGAASYKCYYDVNCPECDFDCEGPLCDIDDCDGPECTAICLGNGCAYDNDYGLSYAYRTVSLNSLSPSGRQLGYNWNNIKGAAAIGEIENKGEEAYSNPEYVITLTPALIQEIKTYNKSQINNGGYANNSLEFVDYTESHTGKTYELLYGESKLLKELNTGSFRDNVSLPSELGVEAHTSWLESDYCRTYTCDSKLGPAYK